MYESHQHTYFFTCTHPTKPRQDVIMITIGAALHIQLQIQMLLPQPESACSNREDDPRLYRAGYILNINLTRALNDAPTKVIQ